MDWFTYTLLAILAIIVILIIAVYLKRRKPKEEGIELSD